MFSLFLFVRFKSKPVLADTEQNHKYVETKIWQRTDKQDKHWTKKGKIGFSAIASACPGLRHFPEYKASVVLV